MNLLKRMFASKLSDSKILAVDNPRLGILNLKENEARSWIEQDIMALRSLFPSIQESSELVPACTVLMIYCDIDSCGHIRDSALTVDYISKRSISIVVVIATENPIRHYIAMGQNPKGINLVLTLNRKGDAFSRFFHRLFAKMKTGTPMSVAWVGLAPQVPGDLHNDCPETIFVCGADGVTLA